MKKTYSATEARKHFFKILDLAGKPGMSVTITLAGKPPLVIMSQEEIKGWKETLEIMSDKALMKQIRNFERERASGKLKTIPWEKVQKELGLPS